MNILNYIVLRYIINMSNSCSPLVLSLEKLFGLDNKSSDEQEKDIEKINDEGKDTPKDITVWYYGPNPITTNKSDKVPDHCVPDH